MPVAGQGENMFRRSLGLKRPTSLTSYDFMIEPGIA